TFQSNCHRFVGPQQTAGSTRVMLILIAVLLLVCPIVASEDVDDVVPRIGSSFGTIMISTIDGQLSALNTGTGDTRWTIQGGSKKDIWLEIDPLTGSKVETMSASSDKVCPVKHHNGIFVGRTEYRISMFDTKNRAKTWNTTFSDYSAHLLPANNDYPYRHYVSHGNIVTVGSG
ncbi:hypothetical protein TELCIR_18723, partial [Teladorsagia circumcincta]